jgi:hypothetical protein
MRPYQKEAVMPSKYAILINEDTLDLIQVINGGVRPLVEDQITWFVFDVADKNTTENHDIKTEDDLYKDNGHLRDQLTLLMG